MTRLTSLDLTPFYRNSIGIDHLFDRLTSQIDAASSTTYPPYNILKTGDNTYEIQVAVAGFTTDDRSTAPFGATGRRRAAAEASAPVRRPKSRRDL